MWKLAFFFKPPPTDAPSDSEATGVGGEDEEAPGGGGGGGGVDDDSEDGAGEKGDSYVTIRMGSSGGGGSGAGGSSGEGSGGGSSGGGGSSAGSKQGSGSASGAEGRVSSTAIVPLAGLAGLEYVEHCLGTKKTEYENWCCKLADDGKFQRYELEPFGNFLMNGPKLEWYICDERGWRPKYKWIQTPRFLQAGYPMTEEPLLMALVKMIKDKYGEDVNQ
jgi:hypothetical protein